MASSFPSTPSQLYNALLISAQYIDKFLPKAEVSIILGSSFAYFSNIIEECAMLDYCDIPFLQVTTVAGHTGILFYGKIGGRPIYCWGGRLHGMEGYSNDQITYITHLSAFLGCHTLITTNSSGTSNPDVNVGDIMLIKDFINNVGKNPLDTHLHATFTNLHQDLYKNKEDNSWVLELAKKMNINCIEGTYCWVKGPSFETPFEIECYSKLGADIFGMSAVPEIMAAQAHGMRVIPIAIIANKKEGGEVMMMEGLSLALGEIREFFREMLKELPEFNGTLKVEWVNEIEPILLNKPKIEMTEVKILETLNWLKEIVGENYPEIALVINSKHVPCFSTYKFLFYSEIPNFPQISLASKMGQFIIGELGSRNIICLLNCNFGGLEIYEAYFVAQILIGLGISHLHYIFPVINKGHNFTKIKDYFSMQLQDCTQSPMMDAEQITSFGDQLVFAFPGPTLPTKAEKEFAHKLEHELITISNMAILCEANNRGLPHSASCFSCDFTEDSLVYQHIFELIESLPSARLSILLKFPSCYPLVDQNLLEPPLSQNDIEDLATEIKICLNPRLTVIVSEDIGNLLLRHFKIRTSYKFRSIIKQSLHFTYDGIMIIKGTPLLKEQENFYITFSPMFLSNRIGVQSLIIIEEVSTCNSSIPLGMIVKITDQCGLAHFNPLLGPNPHSWGVRFPDMGNAFENNIEWKSIFHEHRIDCSETKMLFTSRERGIPGYSLAKIGDLLGAGVIGNTGPYSVIISKHKLSHQPKRKLFYLGYVNHDPVLNASISPPPVEYQLAMHRLILKELKTLV